MADARSYSVPGYELDAEPVGEGGFGRVFRAHPVSSPERILAVKIIDPSAFFDRDKSHARFRREAAALSRLDHPNIVKYVDSGVSTDEPGFPYLVTEFVQGEPFRPTLDLSDVERLRFMVDVLDALDYAHRRGFIHRDIKPGNLMVRSGDKRATILDYGLVSDIDDIDQARLTTRYAGSLGYVPPEVLAGTEPSRANHDIYSCGVTLYEALMGHRPNVQNYVTISSVKPKLSAADGVLQKSLDRVDRRYASASAFSADLSHAIAQLEAIQGLDSSNPRAEAFRVKATERVRQQKNAEEEHSRAKAAMEAKWRSFHEVVKAGAEQAFNDMVPAAQEIFSSASVRSLDETAANNLPTGLLELQYGKSAVRFGRAESSPGQARQLGGGSTSAVPGRMGIKTYLVDRGVLSCTCEAREGSSCFRSGSYILLGAHTRSTSMAQSRLSGWTTPTFACSPSH
jgi:serine/threonine protein kinase